MASRPRRARKPPPVLYAPVFPTRRQPVKESSVDNKKKKKKSIRETSLPVKRGSLGQASKASKRPKKTKTKPRSKAKVNVKAGKQRKAGRGKRKPFVDELIGWKRPVPESADDSDAASRHQFDTLHRMWETPSVAVFLWLLSGPLKFQKFSLSEFETMLVHPAHNNLAEEVFTKLLLWDGTSQSLLGLSKGEGYPFAWWDLHLRQKVTQWFNDAHPRAAGGESADTTNPSQPSNDSAPPVKAEDTIVDQGVSSGANDETDELVSLLRELVQPINNAKPPAPPAMVIEVGDRVEAKFDDGDEWYDECSAVVCFKDWKFAHMF